MSGCPRKDIVRQGKIGIYHCWSRCVQRAMLCGLDPVSGCNFNYRRSCLQDLIATQAAVFAIDVGGYSILNNHFHIVLRSRPDIVKTWSDEEVVWRWKMAWPAWTEEGIWDRMPSDQEIEAWLLEPGKPLAIRQNLSDISWFMARIKEPLARLANAESNTKGHFWDQRFGSRELADESAVLTAAVYVDLNQVEAAMASSLKLSRHSSIYDRIHAQCAREAQTIANKIHDAGEIRTEERDELVVQIQSLYNDCWLAPLQNDGSLWLPLDYLKGQEQLPETSETPVADLPAAGDSVSDGQATLDRQASATKEKPTWKIDLRLRPKMKSRASNDCFLAMTMQQYSEVLAKTLVLRRLKPDDSKQTIERETERQLAELLEPLSIQVDRWVEALGDKFAERFGRVIGPAETILDRAKRCGRQWFKGIRACRDVFT